MKNPFHSQGPELEKNAQKSEHNIQDYTKQLDEMYGNSFFAKILKAILIMIKESGMDQDSEDHRKIHLNLDI